MNRNHLTALLLVVPLIIVCSMDAIAQEKTEVRRNG
jgi:hypothetical protein